MKKVFPIALLALPPFAVAQTQPATAPGIAIPDGPISGTITGIEGNVSIKRQGEEKAVKAAIGLVINEGDEIQTSLRSAVQFQIPPDQTITIDRLSKIQLIRSNFENGKFNTDIGMKYGRTRYDIEAAGREHDAKVRSPSSVLAIRGTKVMLFDQPPFTPTAQSLTGRAFFRDVRKQVAVGTRNGGKTRVTADRDSPAQTALADASVNPKGESATSIADQYFGFSPAAFNTIKESGGVFEIFGQANNQAILDSLSVVGVITGVQPSFEISFTGSDGANIDLEVLSPRGDLTTVLNDLNNGGIRSPSGGNYALNSGPVSTAEPFGVDIVVFDDPLNVAPRGVYTITSRLTSGSLGSASLTILTDKLSSNPGVAGPISQNLSAGSPTAVFQINLQDGTVTTQRVRRKR